MTALVTFSCRECGERLRGEPGAVAKCASCDTWQDAPYPGEPFLRPDELGAQVAIEAEMNPTDDGTFVFIGDPERGRALMAGYDAARWQAAREAGDRRRRELVRAAGLTGAELATAAARFGIVADPLALPLTTARVSLAYRVPAGMTRAEAVRLAGEKVDAAMLDEATARQRELGDVWAGATRTRPYRGELAIGFDAGTHHDLAAGHDAFEERALLLGRTGADGRRWTAFPDIYAAACPFESTSADECAMYRERAAAGRSSRFAECILHGPHPDA